MKRNAKGTGTVFQRTDGRWICRITRNGKTRSCSCKSEQEAIDKLEELKKEMQLVERIEASNIEIQNPNKLTLEKLMTMFLEYKKCGREKISQTSWLRLCSQVQTHILPQYGNIAIYNLNSDMFNSLLDDMFAKGYSHSAIKKTHDALTSCMDYAIFVKKLLPINENPMMGVSMIPEKQFNMTNEVDIFELDEIERLKLECLRKTSRKTYEYRYGRVFIFLLQTGLRAGELCALKKSDINLAEQLVKVSKTAISIKNANGKWETVIQQHPKTNKSRREIPLNNTAIEMATSIMKEFPSSDMFIYTVNNKIVTPNTLNKYFKVIKRNANVDESGGLHKLRDTFASMMFENGVDLITVSKLLGHSSSRVTELHYLKILDRRKMKAVKLAEI